VRQAGPASHIRSPPGEVSPASARRLLHFARESVAPRGLDAYAGNAASLSISLLPVGYRVNALERYSF